MRKKLEIEEIAGQTDVVLATGNPNKVREFGQLFKDRFEGKYRIRSLKDVGFTGEIVEDGDSFEANALIKARAAASLGYIGIADDSGICVDALGGRPGIYSARYSGGSDEDNNDKILSELENVPDELRSAHYVCCIACVFPDGTEFVVRGECHGFILRERHGSGGFGYDPLFYYPPFGKSFGETEPEKKNEVSHRAEASRLFFEKFEEAVKNKQ